MKEQSRSGEQIGSENEFEKGSEPLRDEWERLVVLMRVRIIGFNGKKAHLL